MVAESGQSVLPEGIPSEYEGCSCVNEVTVHNFFLKNVLSHFLSQCAYIYIYKITEGRVQKFES